MAAAECRHHPDSLSAVDQSADLLAPPPLPSISHWRPTHHDKFDDALSALAVTSTCDPKTFANIIDPAAGIDTSIAASYTAAIPPSFKEVPICIFPTNPIKAMSDGNMPQIIVFSILVGVAISQAGEPGKSTLGGFLTLNHVIMRMVTILMHLARYVFFACWQSYLLPRVFR